LKNFPFHRSADKVKKQKALSWRNISRLKKKHDAASSRLLQIHSSVVNQSIRDHSITETARQASASINHVDYLPVHRNPSAISERE
jgi:hypothetical protein